jgi:hypothetical protein
LLSQRGSRDTQGSAVEVLSEGEWWDAHVIELDADASRVKVHYVGGVEDEDEWVDVCDRVRKPVTQVRPAPSTHVWSDCSHHSAARTSWKSVCKK